MKQYRKEYNRLILSESDTLPDPFQQFGIWFRAAADAGISEPNTMAMATVGPDGMPSVRMVLLKGIESEGFVFFSNYDSRKGIHLSQNNKAALLFFWNTMERQIRIEGRIEKTTPAYSDAYFQSRPFESQAAAIASHQSSVLGSREKLEMEFVKLLESKNNTMQRPDYWGGYLLKPVLFEFWQGREHRLHDRIQYRLIDSFWLRERLAP